MAGVSADETSPVTPAAEPTMTPPPVRTLNPAHAILGGAILSAVVTLIGVTLNIRSSERLSAERDKRDVVIAQANELKVEVTDLQRKLEEAVAKIPDSTLTPDPAAATASTAAPPIAPPQSIVVVITVPTALTSPTVPLTPPTIAAVPAVAPTTHSPATTTPVPSSTAAPTTSTSTSSTTSSTTGPPSTTTPPSSGLSTTTKL